MPEITPMKLQCDLVLRGGIASGIVYPRAIAKLAETYDFRSIGGSSAGAIAAAWTAATALAAQHSPLKPVAALAGAEPMSKLLSIATSVVAVQSNFRPRNILLSAQREGPLVVKQTLAQGRGS